MCACDEEFGRRYLPHQISEAKDIQTRERIQVTLGFQPMICDTCRGLPEKACPKKPTYGSTTKVVRYYWREIAMSTIERFAHRLQQDGYTGDCVLASVTHKNEYEECRRQAIDEVKKLHARSPKYVYEGRSQSGVIDDYGVPVIPLDAIYHVGPNDRPRLQLGNELLTPEQFAAKDFERQGFDVLFTESRPFHVLFGVMMWMLIQDPADPRIQMAMFGERSAYDSGQQGKEIHALLPEDFGSPGYAVRRADAICDHLAFLTKAKDELLWLFDYWVEPSASLRQYLWAHRPQDVAIARTILSVLPCDTIVQILACLVGDYWGRYCGWPDLLAHKPGEFIFAEVKSSKDKLSEDQKNWIQSNAEHLRLPFKIVKIHKKTKQ